MPRREQEGDRPIGFEFVDGVQGLCRVDDVGRDLGPFVVQRSDGLVSYHLANALDDTRMRITHSVRGADLIPSAFRQIGLHVQATGYLSMVPVLPVFAHVPVATGPDGVKLGKSRFAPQIDPSRARQLLEQALVFLGQMKGQRRVCEITSNGSGRARDGMRALLLAAAERFSLSAVPAVVERPA